MNNYPRWFSTLMLAVMIGAGSAHALDTEAYDELVNLMEMARMAEVDIFAPKTWAEVMNSFASAEKAIARDKKQETLDKHVAKAREFMENAAKAAEVTKLSLEEYLAPRDRAKEAKAPTLVPLLFEEAEKQMTKAAKKVESGDVKGALKEADKATPLFAEAELEAI